MLKQNIPFDYPYIHPHQYFIHYLGHTYNPSICSIKCARAFPAADTPDVHRGFYFPECAPGTTCDRHSSSSLAEVPCSQWSNNFRSRKTTTNCNIFTRPINRRKSVSIATPEQGRESHWENLVAS